MASKMRPPFVRLHVATLDPATRPGELADALRACDAVTGRHRLAEGAVYASGCRRYLLDTGTSWKQADDAATTWGQSDHRLRVLDDDVIPQAMWRCSCGAVGEWVRADSHGAAYSAAYDGHAEHVAATRP